MPAPPAHPSRVGAECGRHPGGQMTGQGEMQGPRSHVDDANLSLAKAQASGATVAEEVAGATVQPEGTELRSEAHRRHAHKLTGQAGGTSSGGFPGAVAPRQGLASSCASLSGDPHSVGGKGGLFQAEVGPVDGQSLSGLPRGIQAESGRQNARHRSWSCLGSGRPPHRAARPHLVPVLRTRRAPVCVILSTCPAGKLPGRF